MKRYATKPGLVAKPSSSMKLSSPVRLYSLFAAGAIFSALMVGSAVGQANSLKHSTYKTQIVLNGKTVSHPPAFTYKGTTYMPIYYVHNLLKTLGVVDIWAGNSNPQYWTLASADALKVSPAAIDGKTGTITITLNGHSVETNVVRQVAIDPSSKVPTTFVPIWYIQQIFDDLSIKNNWNGSPGVREWDITASAPGVVLQGMGSQQQIDASVQQQMAQALAASNQQLLQQQNAWLVQKLGFPTDKLPTVLVDNTPNLHQQLTVGGDTLEATISLDGKVIEPTYAKTLNGSGWAVKYEVIHGQLYISASGNVPSDMLPPGSQIGDGSAGDTPDQTLAVGALNQFNQLYLNTASTDPKYQQIDSLVTPQVAAQLAGKSSIFDEVTQAERTPGSYQWQGTDPLMDVTANGQYEFHSSFTLTRDAVTVFTYEAAVTVEKTSAGQFVISSLSTVLTNN